MIYLVMLTASMAVTTACSSDDPFDTSNNFTPGGDVPNGNMNGNGSSTAGSGELLSFSVNIDKTTAEPASTVAAYYPEAEDNVETQTFATKVEIDTRHYGRYGDGISS